MFPHLLAPIKLFDNYIIFFLQLFLSFQSSSINPFSPISPLIPSIQVSLGLLRPREELLVFHRAPPRVADRGKLTRYGEYRGNKIPGADQN
jgi:hypothetical protein